MLAIVAIEDTSERDYNETYFICSAKEYTNTQSRLINMSKNICLKRTPANIESGDLF